MTLWYSKNGSIPWTVS